MFVYKKALRLSNASQKSTTMGNIVNHMSTDVNKLTNFFWTAHYSWACPLQVIITLALLVYILGWSALAGVFVMVTVIPLQAKLASKISTFQKSITSTSDERIKKVNEILQGKNP